MKSRLSMLFAFALLMPIVLPTSVMADTRTEQAHINNWLAQLERHSADASREAAEFESLTRSRATWKTHTHYLNSMRERVNGMGAVLADLEDLKPAANPPQKDAIEHARPKLQSLAANVEKMIALLNEDRSAIRDPDYRRALVELHEDTHSLYQGLDAHTDYISAKQRLAGVN